MENLKAKIKAVENKINANKTALRHQAQSAKQKVLSPAALATMAASVLVLWLGPKAFRTLHRKFSGKKSIVPTEGEVKQISAADYKKIVKPRKGMLTFLMDGVAIVSSLATVLSMVNQRGVRMRKLH